MSVESETSKVQYYGIVPPPGTVYTVPFVFYESADVVVRLTNADGIVTTMLNGKHYTVEGGGEEGATGSVTLLLAVPEDTVLITIRGAYGAADVLHPIRLAAGAEYAVTFEFIDKEDLMAVVTDSAGTNLQLALDTDYTVTGGGGATGSITMLKTPADAVMITVYRVTEARQETDYQTGGLFLTKSHELALDRLTYLCQQLLRAVMQLFRLSPVAKGQPELTPRENAVFTLNGDGLAKLRPREGDGEDEGVMSWLNDVPGGFAPGIFTGSAVKVFQNTDIPSALTPSFAGQLGVQQHGNGQFYTGPATGHWTQYTKGTRQFANDAGRAAATPDFQYQLGVQTDSSRKLYFASSTSPGGWTEAVCSQEISDGSVTLNKLATDARAFRAQATNLRIQSLSASTVAVEMDEVVLGSGSAYVRHSDPATITLDLSQSGFNGLDAGSEAANSWYYIWAVSDGTTLGCVFSLDGTAPSVAYSYRLLIGIARNSSGDLVPFVQNNTSYATNPRGVGSIKHTLLTSVSLPDYIPNIAARLRGTIWSNSVTTRSLGFTVASAGVTNRVAAALLGLPAAIQGKTFAVPFDLAIDSDTLSIQTGNFNFSMEITGYELAL